MKLNTKLQEGNVSMVQKARKALRRDKQEDADENLWESENEEDDSLAKRDKFTALVRFVIKSSDVDTAEDLLSDLLSEAVSELGEQYATEGEICDYTIEEIEPAELM